MRFIFYHPRSTDFEQDTSCASIFSLRGGRERQVTSHLSFARKFLTRETSGYEAGMSLFLMLFQALDWIHENGEFYLSSRTGEGESDAQTKELLDEHQEFKEASEVHELVCATFFRSFSLLFSLCFHYHVFKSL